MLVLLAAIFFLHLTCIVLLLAATIHNGWWMTDTVSTDIWARWTLSSGGQWNYTDIPYMNANEYLQAVQASSVLACIFCTLGLFVFVAQLYTLSKGRRFLFTAAFQLLAFVCIMIAASIYTDIFHKNERNGWYGPSFILAWISVCLTLISCVTYFFLRKKTV